jgi:putative ABC transport system permease protein
MCLYCPVNDARTVSGVPEGWSQIVVEADSYENVDGVADAIEAKFGDTVDVISAKSLLQQAQQGMDIIDRFLWVIAVGAAVAGGASIFIVMFMSVTERRSEFGIIKASGWSNGNIISSVVVQSITTALMGAAFGLLIGYGATVGIDHYLGMSIAIITPKLIGEVFGFGILMGVIGGLYPAIRASQVSPIETLRAL